MPAKYHINREIGTPVEFPDLNWASLLRESGGLCMTSHPGN
jgi:hypothetical protein